MNIKNIVPGQTVYEVLFRNSNIEDNYKIHEYLVKKVARKYVTLDSPSGPQYYQKKPTDTYLSPKEFYGDNRKLFLTKKDFEEYLELISLRKSCIKAINWSNIEKYSLQQLRAVKEILDNSNYPLPSVSNNNLE